MNDSRPPMTKAEFLDGYVPIWVDLPNGRTVPATWMKGNVARWLIETLEQRRWSKDFIAQNADVWDEGIWPYVEKVEVMDLATNTIYHIDAGDFHHHKTVINNRGSLRHYVVKIDHWEKELLTMYPSVD